MLCQFRVNYSIKFSLSHVRYPQALLSLQKATGIAVAAWKQVSCCSRGLTAGQPLLEMKKGYENRTGGESETPHSVMSSLCQEV